MKSVAEEYADDMRALRKAKTEELAAATAELAWFTDLRKRINRRRPFDYTADGRMESDRDFMDNNREVIIQFLEKA